MTSKNISKNDIKQYGKLLKLNNFKGGIEDWEKIIKVVNENFNEKDKISDYRKINFKIYKNVFLKKILIINKENNKVFYNKRNLKYLYEFAMYYRNSSEEIKCLINKMENYFDELKYKKLLTDEVINYNIYKKYGFELFKSYVKKINYFDENVENGSFNDINLIKNMSLFNKENGLECCVEHFNAYTLIQKGMRIISKSEYGLKNLNFKKFNDKHDRGNFINLVNLIKNINKKIKEIEIRYKENDILSSDVNDKNFIHEVVNLIADSSIKVIENKGITQGGIILSDLVNNFISDRFYHIAIECNNENLANKININTSLIPNDIRSNILYNNDMKEISSIKNFRKKAYVLALIEFYNLTPSSIGEGKNETKPIQQIPTI